MKRIIIANTVSVDDISWLIEAYEFEPEGNNIWSIETDGYRLTLNISSYKRPFLIIRDYDRNDYRTVSGFENILKVLDKYVDIFATVDIIHSKFRNYIECATNARDLTSRLVRVKSSNIWAYGMNIESNKDKTGDLMIQFKGRNGGPGDIYMYFNVPVQVWRKLLSAPSKGHAFWVLIRNNFSYRKLTGDKRTHLKNGMN